MLPAYWRKLLARPAQRPLQVCWASNVSERRTREVRRIHLPCTPLNKGNKRGGPRFTPRDTVTRRSPQQPHEDKRGHHKAHSSDPIGQSLRAVPFPQEFPCVPQGEEYGQQIEHDRENFHTLPFRSRKASSLPLLQQLLSNSRVLRMLGTLFFSGAAAE